MFRHFHRTHRRRLAAILLSSFTLAAFVCVSSSASAQPEESADAAVDRGVELRRAGDDEGALELFTRAYERDHSPRARAQMALAEQALGRFVEAEAHLVEALAATDDAWIARRREDLQHALEAIRLRLGHLEIRGGVDGADVRIDGRSVATLPLERPIRIATGSYRLEVVARGYYPAIRTVIVVTEATTREAIELSPLPDAPASIDATNATTEPRGERAHGRRVLAASSLGVGGGLLATAVAMYFVRESRAADYNSDACLEGGLSRGENCGDVYDDTIRAQRTSAATLAIGIAAVGAGTLLFAMGGEGDASRASTALACGPDLGGSWGGRCRLRF